MTKVEKEQAYYEDRYGNDDNDGGSEGADDVEDKKNK